MRLIFLNFVNRHIFTRIFKWSGWTRRVQLRVADLTQKRINYSIFFYFNAPYLTLMLSKSFKKYINNIVTSQNMCCTDKLETLQVFRRSFPFKNCDKLQMLLVTGLNKSSQSLYVNTVCFCTFSVSFADKNWTDN